MSRESSVRAERTWSPKPLRNEMAPAGALAVASAANAIPHAAASRLIRRKTSGFGVRGNPPARTARSGFSRELRAAGEAHLARNGSSPSLQILTPQELQVALTVAGGATNREAAAALFLSTKTVEFHLSNTYRKLGVRSRAELVRRVDGFG